MKAAKYKAENKLDNQARNPVPNPVTETEVSKIDGVDLISDTRSTPVWLELEGVRAVKLPTSDEAFFWNGPRAAEVVFEDGETVLIPPSQISIVGMQAFEPDPQGRLQLGLSRLCFEGRGRDGLLEFWRLPENDLGFATELGDEAGSDWNPERIAISPDRVRKIHQAGRLVWSRV